jgi:hypothetical protein
VKATARDISALLGHRPVSGAARKDPT